MFLTLSFYHCQQANYMYVIWVWSDLAHLRDLIFMNSYLYPVTSALAHLFSQWSIPVLTKV
jgi:hypothetical protein